MVVKINPSRVPLWRDPQTLQLGLGADAVVLDTVSASQEKLINLLYRGVADASLNTIASTVGSQPRETKELLERLTPVLVTSADNKIKAPSLSGEFIEQAFAEIIRNSFLSGADGQATLQARANRQVSLASADKSSLVLALALASAGIGAVSSNDNSPVTMQDIGPLGYSSSELGSSRVDALARRLELGNHPCRLVRPGSKHFTLALTVFTSMHMTPNHVYRDAMKGSTPHLAIEYGFGETVVTPLVIPGKTACLSCRQQSMAQQDENWATLTTQLQFRNDRLDDTQSTLLATALALEKILAFIDDSRKTEFEGSLIDQRSGQIMKLQWPIDATCECQDLTARSKRT